MQEADAKVGLRVYRPTDVYDNTSKWMTGIITSIRRNVPCPMTPGAIDSFIIDVMWEGNEQGISKGYFPHGVFLKEEIPVDAKFQAFLSNDLKVLHGT